MSCVVACDKKAIIYATIVDLEIGFEALFLLELWVVVGLDCLGERLSVDCLTRLMK